MNFRYMEDSRGELVQVHTYVCIYRHKYTDINVYIYMYVCINIYIYIYTYIYTYIYMYKCIYRYTYIYIYIYTHIYIYIYIYIPKSAVEKACPSLTTAWSLLKTFLYLIIMMMFNSGSELVRQWVHNLLY
jgi:hypothetical protein